MGRLWAGASFFFLIFLLPNVRDNNNNNDNIRYYIYVYTRAIIAFNWLHRYIGVYYTHMRDKSDYAIADIVFGWLRRDRDDDATLKSRKYTL